MTTRRTSLWVLDVSLVILAVVAALTGFELHRHLVGPTVTDGEYARWQRWIPEMQLAFFISLATSVWLAMPLALWVARGRRRQLD